MHTAAREVTINERKHFHALQFVDTDRDFRSDTESEVDVNILSKCNFTKAHGCMLLIVQTFVLIYETIMSIIENVNLKTINWIIQCLYFLSW